MGYKYTGWMINNCLKGMKTSTVLWWNLQLKCIFRQIRNLQKLLPLFTVYISTVKKLTWTCSFICSVYFNSYETYMNMFLYFTVYISTDTGKKLTWTCSFGTKVHMDSSLLISQGRSSLTTSNQEPLSVLCDTLMCFLSISTFTSLPFTIYFGI